MARGAFPDAHPLCLGMPGMHGNYTAVTAMQQADLLIALGSRFDDRVTGRVGAFAPDAKIIHVDIDPAELGKVRRPDVPIVGDARLVISELIDELNRAAADRRPRRNRTRPPFAAAVLVLLASLGILLFRRSPIPTAIIKRGLFAPTTGLHGILSIDR